MGDSTDFIVVGAGINGLMTTFSLAMAGKSVRVIDRAGPANHNGASWGNHRLIHPFTNCGAQLNQETAVSSLRLWKQILSRIESNGFVQTGVIAVIVDEGLDSDAFAFCSPELISKDDVGRENPLLVGASFSQALMFREFGVLMAAEILVSVTNFLAKTSLVKFTMESAILVNSTSASVRTDTGSYYEAGRTVIAAGVGTREILDNSPTLGVDLSKRFVTNDCHVVNCHHPSFSVVDQLCSPHAPAWASLGLGDLWGMPPVRGQPIKLGCGSLTAPAGKRNVPFNSGELAEKIIRNYAEKFPMFRDCTAASVETRV